MPADQAQPVHSTTQHWRDGNGRQWRIHADSQHIDLRGPDYRETIPRSEWDQRIDYNEAGGGLVIRLDLADRQIGFLLSSEQAGELFTTLEWSNQRAAESAARLRSLEQRPHTWPTVTAWSIVALFAAALTVLPILGWASAALAVTCMIFAIRRSRSDPRLRHTPLLVAAAAIIATAGLAANLAAIITLNHTSAATPASDPTSGSPSGWVNVVAALLVVLLSLSVHEAAHAVTAWWCGDEGPLRDGRVTLNPLAHIDPIGTILVPAFLAYAGQPVFAWARPVRVSLHGVPNARRANLLISAAGPASNLLLSLIFLAGYVLLGCGLHWGASGARIVDFTVPLSAVHIEGVPGAMLWSILAVCLKWGFLINALLCFFNLLPLPPLDGAHVLESLFPASVGPLYRKLGPYSFFILLALLYTGVIGRLLAPAVLVIRLGFAMVAAITGL